MADLTKVSWSVAGAIAVSTVLGWIWFTNFMDERYPSKHELAALQEALSTEHDSLYGAIYTQDIKMVRMQLEESRRAVRFWQSKVEPLTPDEQIMLDEQLTFVRHYTQYLLDAGERP